MAFLPRSFVSEPNSSFTSLFRLLDDYDTYTNSGSGPLNHNKSQINHRNNDIMKTFHPKFDVRELADAYELHGELPGIDQKDIDIEFVDAQTLSIKGHIERTHQSGPRPAAVQAPKAAGAIEDKTDDNSHKVKVEDEDEDAATTNETTSTDVAKAEEKPPTAAESNKQKGPDVKYWLSERSIGEFSRHFTFPMRIDQEAVSASMKNGILSLTVPKAKKHESRKITIS